MTETLFLIVLDLMFFCFLLALLNLCLIAFMKRGFRFKLANFGIFLVYGIPLIALAAGWERLFSAFGFWAIPIGVTLHFIFLILAWRSVQRERAWKVAKFAAALFVMMVICTIVWQDVVTEYLYDNSDDNMMGFLHPFYLDGWIGQGNSPVVAVRQVVHRRSMSEPDQIKEGWSISKLWCLWFSFVAISLVISIVFARGSLIPKRQIKPDHELAHDTVS